MVCKEIYENLLKLENDIHADYYVEELVNLQLLLEENLEDPESIERSLKNGNCDHYNDVVDKVIGS